MPEYEWARPHRKAAKPHICQMCKRVIDPGETYLRGCTFYDGTAQSWNECAHCESMQVTFDIQDDGSYNEDLFYVWAHNSETIAELRAGTGYLMKWRTKSGKLLPLPA